MFQPLETEDIHVASVESDESGAAGEVGPADDMTAAGYDEAVEKGEPFANEHEVLAQHAAEPVTLTEIEPLTEDELDPGRRRTRPAARYDYAIA